MSSAGSFNFAQKEFQMHKALRNSVSACSPMFIAKLFTVARTCKQPRCPSTDEWSIIEVVIHIHNGILLSPKKECIGDSSNEVDETGAYYVCRVK